MFWIRVVILYALLGVTFICYSTAGPLNSSPEPQNERNDRDETEVEQDLNSIALDEAVVRLEEEIESENEIRDSLSETSTTDLPSTTTRSTTSRTPEPLPTSTQTSASTTERSTTRLPTSTTRRPIFVGPRSRGRYLMYNDDFDGNELDRNSWFVVNDCNSQRDIIISRHQRIPKNNCRDSNNVEVKNGTLILTVKNRLATEEPSGQSNFTSAKVVNRVNRSKGGLKLGWRHGLFTVRARLPRGNFRPVISLKVANPLEHLLFGSPPGMSFQLVDGMLPDVSGFNYGIKYGEKVPFNDSWSDIHHNTSDPVDLSSGFHTYTLDWTPEVVTLFMDDTFVYSYNEDVNGTRYAGEGVELDFNFAIEPIDTSRDVSHDDNHLDAKPTLEIDYVRVYQYIRR